MTDEGHVTRLVNAWRQGDDNALAELTPLVYDELRRLARRKMANESGSHTLQATALVNEAFIRLGNIDLEYQSRAHFHAMAANTMRRILVDHARKKKSAKRGGAQTDLTLDESVVAATRSPVDVLDLDRALEELAEQDEGLASAIELVFFGGLSYEEAAAALGVSRSKLYEDLRLGKAWLHVRLADMRAG